MQINSKMINRIDTSYQTNQNVKYFSGVTKNEDGSLAFSEVEEGTGFVGKFVNVCEFQRQWMQQDGGNKMEFHFGTSFDAFAWSETKYQLFIEKVAKPENLDTTQNDDVSEDDMSAEEMTDCWQVISDKIEELFIKIQNGETEPSYQIGSQSFTIKEWDEFLQKFDTMEEAIRELQKKEQEVRQAKEEQKKRTESGEVDVSLLVAETVSCRFPSANSGEDDTMYLIAYDVNGIRCIKAGETEYEWEIQLENVSQYEKVRDFLNGLGNLDNMRFAAHENFWQDFFQDKIDIEDFKSFLAGTNNGVPDYSITIGDSMYIDKEKIKYAPYMNSFGAHFYSGDEFQKQQAEIIAANAAKLTKLTDSYTDIYRISHPEYNGERIFCEYPGGPLYTADEIAERMMENLKNPNYR